MPDKKTVVKIGINKTVYHRYFFLVSHKSCQSTNAIWFDGSFRTQLGYMLKLSWLSFSIPSNFIDLVVSISLLYIFNLCVIWFSLRIVYHVIVPKPIYRCFWFFLSVRRRSFRFLQVTAMLLLSAKLCKPDFVTHKDKSFIKMFPLFPMNFANLHMAFSCIAVL